MQDMHAWILIGLGAICTLGALALSFKPEGGLLKVLVVWVFAVALLGLGVFGQGFLTDYREFVEVLAQLAKDGEPSKKAQERALEMVAQGQLDRSEKQLALWAVTRKPTPATLPLLAEYAQRVEDPSTRKLIESERLALARDVANTKQWAVLLKKNGQLDRRHLEQLDPRTRRLFDGYVKTLSAEELRRLQLDPRDLTGLRVLPQR